MPGGGVHLQGLDTFLWPHPAEGILDIAGLDAGQLGHGLDEPWTSGLAIADLDLCNVGRTRVVRDGSDRGDDGGSSSGGHLAELARLWGRGLVHWRKQGSERQEARKREREEASERCGSK